MIFMGVGAMTDFGPLIANPKSALGGHHARGKVVADHEHRNKKGTE